jgi:DNA-binding NarL/FixJ family response regulator
MASVISRTTGIDDLVNALHRVAAGRPVIDEAFVDRLPQARSSHRAGPAYQRLVPHAGHAKLWRALLADDDMLTYKDIADRSGLSVNTVRNYRDDLLPELRLHGLDNPPMHRMQRFAHLARPLILAAIDARCGRRGERAGAALSRPG